MEGFVEVNNERSRRENIPRTIKYNIKTNSFYTLVGVKKIPVFCDIVDTDICIKVYSKPNNDRNKEWSKHDYTYNEKSISIVREFFSKVRHGETLYGDIIDGVFVPKKFKDDYRRINDKSNKG